MKYALILLSFVFVSCVTVEPYGLFPAEQKVEHDTQIVENNANDISKSVDAIETIINKTDIKDHKEVIIGIDRLKNDRDKLLQSIKTLESSIVVLREKCLEAENNLRKANEKIMVLKAKLFRYRIIAFIEIMAVLILCLYAILKKRLSLLKI